MVTGEDTELKQSASSSSDPKPTATASGGICYWPEQSCDSLPPLPGKVAAGLVGGRGMEFSVNEECELFGIHNITEGLILCCDFI